ncbi:hypothetical protein OIU78_014323 [Salix suchowensis]|nr:hypothetical protein OIU78_014323 [Salix suchowensis]
MVWASFWNQFMETILPVFEVFKHQFSPLEVKNIALLVKEISGSGSFSKYYTASKKRFLKSQRWDGSRKRSPFI